LVSRSLKKGNYDKTDCLRYWRWRETDKKRSPSQPSGMKMDSPIPGVKEWRFELDKKKEKGGEIPRENTV